MRYEDRGQKESSGWKLDSEDAVCHHDAVLSFTRRDVRTDLWVVSPLLHSGIFVFSILRYSVFGTQPSKTRRFLHCLI